MVWDDNYCSEGLLRGGKPPRWDVATTRLTQRSLGGKPRTNTSLTLADDATVLHSNEARDLSYTAPTLGTGGLAEATRAVAEMPSIRLGSRAYGIVTAGRVSSLEVADVVTSPFEVTAWGWCYEVLYQPQVRQHGHAVAWCCCSGRVPTVKP